MFEHEDAEAFDQQTQEQVRAVARASKIALKRLLILGEAEVRLPNLGSHVRLYKVADRESGTSQQVALDPSGKRVDLTKLERQEQAAARERYGNLQEALHNLLEERGGEEDQRVPVLVRYAVDEHPVDLDKTEIDASKLTARRLRDISQRAARHVEQVAEQTAAAHLETLRRYDVGEDTQPRPSGPFIRTELPLRVVRELSRDKRIAFIGLDAEQEIPDYPTIAESLPTTRTNTVHASGAKGAGVRIAVLEGGTTNVAAGCFNIVATQDASAAANDHMTKSVGIIGNRWTTGGGCSGSWQGYAPDAEVLLANASSYTDRYDWARGQGVNVVTMSWHFGSEETSGGLHSRDVYFDYWATRWPYPSIFTSAGNQAASDAYASGKGFNVMGVANILNDGDGDRCNDAIASSSSWKNPTSTHGDREVPAIAAPGSRHELLGSSFGGTSCATPVAASIAAVLMSHNPSLKIWPEAIRAIMLATANFQLADGASFATWSDGKDGTASSTRFTGCGPRAGASPAARRSSAPTTTASCGLAISPAGSSPSPGRSRASATPAAFASPWPGTARWPRVEGARRAACSTLTWTCGSTTRMACSWGGAPRGTRATSSSSSPSRSPVRTRSRSAASASRPPSPAGTASRGPRTTISVPRRQGAGGVDEGEVTVSLAQVAAILGRPVERLVELDRRPLRLAFVPAGKHETFVVRDEGTGEIREVTVSVATGTAADPDELRRQDARAAEVAASLSSELRALLLRHPDLPALMVVVHRGAAAGAERGTLSAREVVALADDPTVSRVELAGDPEIADAD
ncbi:MAG TPA: S8 family serine peptidase [Egibacteraceae bacterium]|nr:S8 family serine peptidase [Egibacteraceae bacterium]